MEAINLVEETGQASTPFLQRKLKIGYARASKIIDQLEIRSAVSVFNKYIPRQINFQKLTELKKQLLMVQPIFEQQTQDKIDREWFVINSLSNGLEFEQYIGNLLQKLNYTNVEVTQASNDYGVDVLAEKEGIKYTIQIFTI